MAKRKIIEVQKEVKFLKDFQGTHNDFTIKVRAGEILSLPLIIYNWIQKFKVCEDA